MNFFRRSFVKCFSCKKKEDKKKAYLLQYKAADGLGSTYLCENCAAELDNIASNMKDVYDDE